MMSGFSFEIFRLTYRETCCKPDSEEGKVYCTEDQVSIQIPTQEDEIKGKGKKIKLIVQS